MICSANLRSFVPMERASRPDEDDPDGWEAYGDAWTFEDLHQTRKVYGNSGAIFSLGDDGPACGEDFFGELGKDDGELGHTDRFELDTVSNYSHHDASLGPDLEQASQRSPCRAQQSSPGLFNTSGRMLCDLVPFAVGGTNPGEEMEALAARFADLRVEGEEEGGTFSNWNGMLEICERPNHRNTPFTGGIPCPTSGPTSGPTAGPEANA